jgi:hypothetical protein
MSKSIFKRLFSYFFFFFFDSNQQQLFYELVRYENSKNNYRHLDYNYLRVVFNEYT